MYDGIYRARTDTLSTRSQQQQRDIHAPFVEPEPLPPPPPLLLRLEVGVAAPEELMVLEFVVVVLLLLLLLVAAAVLSRSLAMTSSSSSVASRLAPTTTLNLARQTSLGLFRARGTFTLPRLSSRLSLRVLLYVCACSLCVDTCEPPPPRHANTISRSRANEPDDVRRAPRSSTQPRTTTTTTIQNQPHYQQHKHHRDAHREHRAPPQQVRNELPGCCCSCWC